RASNNLKNDKVYPKMKLNLASYTTKKPRSMSKIHIVQKGETLSSISNKYGIDISRLRASNNLKNDKVYPKMKLKIVRIEG
ncbi:MAG TPA: LysM peptidoglycan-binding domain-containing protein, partial [Syntrophorhabdaceae bacterium]|nr:LysM peptidoglycan-binding domain-containing protein [Syntrophorhabdaceae bacterium]